MDKKKLERVNHKIKSRLQLHSNIKTYNKSRKIVRQNINEFRNKVPMLRRYGIRSDLKSNAMNTLEKSEDYTAQGIIMSSKGIGIAKATIRTGIDIIKQPYRVGKTAYRITKFTIRTGKRLAGKKYALDPQLKESLFSKQRRNKKLKKKRPSLLSQAKGGASAPIQIQKEDTTNTGIASIQQGFDTRRQLRPYSNLAKKAAKATYNIAKKPIAGIARKNQYNTLQSLRTKQRELKFSKSGINTASKGARIKTARMKTRVKSARRKAAKRMASNVTNFGFKATAKTSIKLTKALGKILINPLTIKIAAIACIALLLISIITSAISAIITPVSTVIADEETVIKYCDKISELNESFKNEIDEHMTRRGYDEHVLKYMSGEGTVNVNVAEILAIMAVKYEQNLKFSWPEQNTIEDLARRMIEIKTERETYYDSGCKPIYSRPPPPEVPKLIGWTCPGHKRLNVYVYTYDMEEVMQQIGFTEDQKDWARILVSSDLASMFPNVPGLSSETRSAEEIQALIAAAPATDVTRSALMQTAQSLVGRVGYFWGGKSSAGWNSNWGVDTLVTAEGSTTTGTYRPYGLDCSGFVDWVYKTAGVGDEFSGGGTAYQWNQSYSISESNLLPGDLVFKSMPYSSGINHVGLYLGRDNAGKKLYVHCASGQGVVVDSYSGFKYYRRAFVKFPF